VGLIGACTLIAETRYRFSQAPSKHVPQPSLTSARCVQILEHFLAIQNQRAFPPDVVQ